MKGIVGGIMGTDVNGGAGIGNLDSRFRADEAGRV